MSEPSSGPPNPRDPRYREMPVQGYGTPITTFLIAVCCLVAVVTKLGSDPSPVSWMYFGDRPDPKELSLLLDRLESTDWSNEEEVEAYGRFVERLETQASGRAGVLARIMSGEVWRLVTPIFLHFGAIHLLFNMMWLWTLGRPLEILLRKPRYLLCLLVIAVVSNLVQGLMQGPNFGGMSGVVYGLFGFVWVHGKLNPAGGLVLNPRTVQFMLIWLVLCFTGMVGPIANWAHTFGLLSGAGLGAIMALRGGGLQALKRRQEFRRAVTANTDSLYQCAVCGKTEKDDPALEFRVGQDGEDYCLEHLPGGDGGDSGSS